jgi:hypothetical protein
VASGASLKLITISSEQVASGSLEVKVNVTPFSAIISF